MGEANTVYPTFHATAEWGSLDVTDGVLVPTDFSRATVAGTLGLLLLVRSAMAWLLLPIPLLWCIVQGTTLVLLKSPDALVLPALALVVLIVAVERRIRR